MQTFLLEAYIATIVGVGVEALATRARAAAEGLSAAGRPVRCLRSILVEDDDTCFFLFEASAADDVREVAERAELPFCRISDAITDNESDTRAESQWGAHQRPTTTAGTREAGERCEELYATD